MVAPCHLQPPSQLHAVVWGVFAQQLLLVPEQQPMNLPLQQNTVPLEVALDSQEFHGPVQSGALQVASIKRLHKKDVIPSIVDAKKHLSSGLVLDWYT